MNIKNLFSRALPVAGKVAGAYFGGPIGAKVGQDLGQMGSDAIEKKKPRFNVPLENEDQGGEMGAIPMNLFNRIRSTGQDMDGILKMIQMFQRQ